VDLLDILAVVSFIVGQTEEALLKDRVLTIPQRQRYAEALLVVADPRNAILAPAVDAAAGVVVSEVVPGGAVGAVVLADCAPLALAQVRPPLLPRPVAEAILLQPTLLFTCDRLLRTHFLDPPSSLVNLLRC